ncbi:hypothetical protein [Pontimonas salivibrio]|uniref:hypothetical protein n=1 Tax=Pontimonas salivibrio TaxID=1159327 RepID=UPI000CF35BB2|nr:hypothetical protein [Pontimonas salivibrio]
MSPKRSPPPSAETEFLLSESKLADLEDEERDNAARLLDIPAEQGDAWALCTNVINDELFGSGATAADEAGCEEWRQLQDKKETLTVRQDELPAEIKSARDLRNTAQVKALSADRAFDASISFGFAGVAVSGVIAVTLWIIGLQQTRHGQASQSK